VRPGTGIAKEDITASIPANAARFGRAAPMMLKAQHLNGRHDLVIVIGADKNNAVGERARAHHPHNNQGSDAERDVRKEFFHGQVSLYLYTLIGDFPHGFQ
jgi:uncharacterized protein involved in copper resistance